MQTAKIFQNGQSQAWRLPKGFRFQGDEVAIRRVGNAVILQPGANAWETPFEFLDELSTDFMEDREQQPVQARLVFRHKTYRHYSGPRSPLIRYQ